MSQPASTAPFVIVGAGLGGSLLAALLGRRGYGIEVLERRPDPRVGPVEAGRSINLAISARGLDALDRIGLRDTVLKLAIPLRGRMIHPVAGGLAFQPYGTRGQAINSISRAALNATLISAAEGAGGVAFRFSRRCTELDLAAGAVTSVDASSGEGPRRHAGTIVGADGAWSVVRTQLQRSERLDYSQEFLGHGYKELQIPAGSGGVHRLDPNALHIWPRGGYMMMAMANLDGSFTVTLYLPFQGADGFDGLQGPDDLRRFFDRAFPDAIPLLPTFVEDFFANPTGSLVTIRSRPWHLGGAAVLLGDAAHAIVPFFGQGANAAFEDCIALSEQLTRHPADRAAAFRGYETERRPNTRAIADLALANFHEMRAHVASPMFRLEKRAGALLHRLLPRWFVPLYTMISFTLIPYAEAERRARRQKLAVRLGLGVVALLLLLLLITAVR